MKKYLFRAWDKRRKIMLSNHTFETIAKLGLYGNSGLIWMRFIGLVDKNKKRIFEHDVVKHKNYNHLMKVVWVESHCCFKLISKDGGESNLTNTISSMLEVVGNTLEKPNLLKEE